MYENNLPRSSEIVAKVNNLYLLIRAVAFVWDRRLSQGLTWYKSVPLYASR